MTLYTISHKEKIDGSKKYERDEYTLGSHYTVVRNITRFEDGDKLIRIHVDLSYEDRYNNYFPEIYYENDDLAGQNGEFKIQTTAYGTMNPDEIKKVIAGYQEAIEAVEILTKKFC